MGREIRDTHTGRPSRLMIFQQTGLKGAYIVDPERIEDDRGFFARAWCRREFAEHGLSTDLAQCNISFNRRKGTLRGMHFQTTPRAEARVVRCTAGAIYDVIVDLRPDSDTFKQWIGVELTAESRRLLYIPEGLAHGFLTLSDNVEVFYQMSEFYSAEHARGVRWNDPAFGIEWPGEVVVISERDRGYPDFGA
jgi:dTDP-4-dehydrorhamnose 3,5-epimerase